MPAAARHPLTLLDTANYQMRWLKETTSVEVVSFEENPQV